VCVRVCVCARVCVCVCVCVLECMWKACVCVSTHWWNVSGDAVLTVSHIASPACTVDATQLSADTISKLCRSIVTIITEQMVTGRTLELLPKLLSIVAR
jgi:hypothetical protein